MRGRGGFRYSKAGLKELGSQDQAKNPLKLCHNGSGQVCILQIGEYIITDPYSLVINSEKGRPTLICEWVSAMKLSFYRTCYNV